MQPQINQAPIQTNTLLNLSGGLDSTLCAYNHLKSGQDIILHHINLTTREGRISRETEANKNVINWLSNQDLPGKFIYHESSFDYGTIRYIVKDVYVWAFLSSILLANPKLKHVNKLIIPRHLDAFGHEVDPSGLAKRSNRILQQMFALVAKCQDIQLTFPIGSYKKSQIIKALPTKLLKLCWWCRTPTKEGLPCHKCITCKTVDPTLSELNLNSDTFYSPI